MLSRSNIRRRVPVKPLAPPWIRLNSLLSGRVAAETDLQFDGWTVNRVSGEISRDGRASRLPQQPLRILVELYDHAGEIVTRDQLVKILWPAGIVDFDNGLNVAMRKLRVALDDVGDAPRYIETLPKVGYRFMGRPARVAGVAARNRQCAAARAAESRCSPSCSWRSAASSGGRRVACRVRETLRAHARALRAQELYLKAIHERSRRDVNPTDSALALLEDALKEDPEYAAAWAAYGFTLGGSVMRQMTTPGETIPKARAAAERAIALEPDLVDGHVLMVHVLMDHEKNFRRRDGGARTGARDG